MEFKPTLVINYLCNPHKFFNFPKPQLIKIKGKSKNPEFSCILGHHHYSMTLPLLKNANLKISTWHFFKKKRLIGRYLLYNAVFVSAIRQHKSTVTIHIFPPSQASLPPTTLHHPSRLLQSTGLSSLCYTETSH